MFVLNDVLQGKNKVGLRGFGARPSFMALIFKREPVKNKQIVKPKSFYAPDKQQTTSVNEQSREWGAGGSPGGSERGSGQQPEALGKPSFLRR